MVWLHRLRNKIDRNKAIEIAKIFVEKMELRCQPIDAIFDRDKWIVSMHMVDSINDIKKIVISTTGKVVSAL